MLPVGFQCACNKKWKYSCDRLDKSQLPGRHGRVLAVRWWKSGRTCRNQFTIKYYAINTDLLLTHLVALGSGAFTLVSVTPRWQWIVAKTTFSRQSTQNQNSRTIFSLTLLRYLAFIQGCNIQYGKAANFPSGGRTSFDSAQTDVRRAFIFLPSAGSLKTQSLRCYKRRRLS